MQSDLQQSKELFSSLQSPYKEFYEFHGIQLIGINFPPSPEKVCELYDILTKQIYDSGEYFQLLENQNTESFEVVAQKPLKTNEKIFLVDHAMSFRYPDLRKALKENPKMISRLLYILKFWDNKKQLGYGPGKAKKHPLAVEYEYMDIEDPLKYEVKPETLTLSFYGNQIKDLSLVEHLCEKSHQIKVLWLNENPISENPAVWDLIEKKYTNVEIFNSKFTKNAGLWALNYLISDCDLNKMQETIAPEKVRFINLSDRNIFNMANPDIFKLFSKLKKVDLRGHSLDTLESTNKLFYILGLLPKLKEVLVDDSVAEVLWSLYDLHKLEEVSKSLRIVNGFWFSYGRPIENQKDIEYIVRNISKIANCYRLANTEQLDETSIWYIMDELGSGIQHSDTPNVAMAPFLFAPNNKFDEHMISYNLIWPTQNLEHGQNLFRDYLFGIDETRFRSAKLACWFDIPYSIFIENYQNYKKNMDQTTAKGLETLKQKDIEFISKKNLSELQPLGILPNKARPLYVITDLPIVSENLKHQSFALTTKLEESDIIFLTANIKDNFWELSKEKYINQFPFEACIVMKNNLAKTVSESLGYVDWLQHTYDLTTHLHEFMGEYKTNQEKDKTNIWIIKPPNMARSMDMVVTNNLDVILRLLETGPKLAQKYIHKPVTLRRKKIDLRFIVLLRSIKPLEVFLYKVFWIRTANNDFVLDQRSLEVYETHFTVMNYGHNLTQIHYHEFIPEFNNEYKNRNVVWDDVYNKIKQMVKELFIGVEMRYPEMHAENARSVYGMDVMIDSTTFQPKLLEMTFSPDCNRACKYHPHFYDDLFSCLYLHKDDCNVERVV